MKRGTDFAREIQSRARDFMKRRSARALYLTDYQERVARVAVWKRELTPRG
jgi:hypothetical protein